MSINYVSRRGGGGSLNAYACLQGGGGGHRLACVSKFTKRYFRLFQIFAHILSLLNNCRMKFRLTKFSHYDVLPNSDDYTRTDFRF